MATASRLPAETSVASPSAVHAKLSKGPGKVGSAIFAGVLVIGFVYAGYHLIADLSVVHSASFFPYFLLGIALLVALGFEFVNGFHDTANAVATVIYTHSHGPAHCGGVVGNVELRWSGALDRSGRVRHHFAAAG